MKLLECAITLLVLIASISPRTYAAKISSVEIFVNGQIEKSIISAVRSSVSDTLAFLNNYDIKLPPTRLTLFETNQIMEKALVANWDFAPDKANHYAQRSSGLAWKNEIYISAQNVKTAHQASPQTLALEKYAALIISHELIHVAQYALAKHPDFQGYTHGWLTEGSAELLSRMAIIKSPITPIEPVLVLTFAPQLTQQLIKTKLSELSDWHDFEAATKKYGAINVYAIAFSATFLISQRQTGRVHPAHIFSYFKLFEKFPASRNSNFRRAFGVSQETFDKEFQKYLTATIGK